jgi:hypothetical protein
MAGRMEAYPEKTEATVKTGQKEMGAKIKASQEENATVKASQEKIEANRGGSLWRSTINGYHMQKPCTLLLPCRARLPMLYVETRAMYEETIGALKDQFEDQHLAAGYLNQLKTQTQEDGELLLEFGTSIEQLTHCAFPTLHDPVHMGPGKAFGEKRPRHKTAATSGKQQNAHGGSQADPRAGSHKASSRVFRQASENE